MLGRPLVAGFLGDQAVTGLDAVAIHPGGPAILRAVERSMSLTAGQTAASWTALQRSGNTSSAAILSVLAELDSSRTAMPGKGLAIGFGPGLSVELLELGWRC